jgi:hypothetical protein
MVVFIASQGFVEVTDQQIAGFIAALVNRSSDKYINFEIGGQKPVLPTLEREPGSNTEILLMTSRAASLVLSLMVFACVNHDLEPSSRKTALLVASSMCGKDAADMNWFDALLQAGETDFGQRGDIYAIVLDGNVIFVHQPVILSCWACRLYDCNGDLIQITVENHEKIWQSMNSATKIYSIY